MTSHDFRKFDEMLAKIIDTKSRYPTRLSRGGDADGIGGIPDFAKFSSRLPLGVGVGHVPGHDKPQK